MGEGTQNYDTPVQGLPLGAIVRPPAPVQGLPPGAIVKPITPQTNPSPQAAPATPTMTSPTHPSLLTAAARATALGPLGISSTTAQPIADAINKAGRFIGKFSETPSQEVTDIPGAREYIQYSRGFGKGGSETVLGLSHLLGANSKDEPDTTAYGGMEDAGKLAEAIVEFAGGDEALKSLGLADRLAELSKFTKVLEKYPRLAAMLGRNVQQGIVAGAQTMAKTGGDVKAAGEAAALTGGIGLLTEGAGAGVRKFLENNAATRATVGGVETVVPGNVRKTLMKPEQQAGQEAIRRSAQDTLGQHLQEVNESRAISPSPPALPARTGPFEFELQGPGTAEQTAGRGVVPAAEMPRRNITGLPQNPAASSESARNIEELGSTAQATPARLMRDQPYMTSPAPGAEAETVGNPQGGGTLRTQDPNIVRQHIANLNEIIDHADFETLPAEQQQQILAARSDAQRQMAQYNAHLQTLSPRANRPNFEQIDIPATVQRIGSYTAAAEHLEGIATDGYNSIADSLMLNDISGGKFNAIRNANKDAWAAYKGATSHEGLAIAENAIDQTNQQMRDLLQHDIGGAVSEKELAGFNEAYGQAQMLKHVAAAVDGSFTGNTGQAAQPWEYRGFNGTRLASNLDRLVRRYGRPTIERSIGAHNLDTLYQVAELNRTDAGRAKFGAALTPVMQWLAKGDFLHVGAIGVGGLAGRMAGLPFEAGALGGMATSIIGKKVMNAVMTNPKIAEYLIYVIDHAVQPKIYGPLIGGMIVQQESAK